jgi:hypothetical protein
MNDGIRPSFEERFVLTTPPLFFGVAPYRSGRSKDWLKFKNPEAPASFSSSAPIFFNCGSIRSSNSSPSLAEVKTGLAEVRALSHRYRMLDYAANAERDPASPLQ